MNTIRISTKDLLEKVKANREQHHKIFLEALSGYKKRVISELEKRLAEAKEGRNFDQYISLEQPIDMTREYDRVVTMLEMSLDEEINLSERDFAKYVMDEWQWKSHFVSCNSVYSATAAKAMNPVS